MIEHGKCILSARKPDGIIGVGAVSEFSQIASEPIRSVKPKLGIFYQPNIVNFVLMPWRRLLNPTRKGLGEFKLLIRLAALSWVIF
jgi:hypothetical protein